MDGVGENLKERVVIQLLSHNPGTLAQGRTIFLDLILVVKDIALNIEFWTNLDHNHLAVVCWEDNVLHDC